MEILLKFLFILFFIPFMGLITTIFIEWIIYSAIIRKKIWKLLGYSILINGITNPLANLLLLSITSPIGFLIVEFLVLISEVFIIKHLIQTSYKKAILISIVANIITGSLSIFLR